jgi:hypothetical protein
VRFFVHGNISFYTDTLAVKWLLDSQYLLDQSILLDCQKCIIEYQLGSIGINATELNVSIPGISYDMSVFPSRKQGKRAYSLPHELDTAGEERHPLIYVPSISSKISIRWKMLCDNNECCYYHHSPYIQSESESNELSPHDAFVCFRSDGISLVNFDFDLPGTELIGNWVLLRIDVLPWLTHVNSTFIHNSESDDHRSESFPRLQSAAISVRINELKIATWFVAERELDWDEHETEGVCIAVKSLSYTASGGDKDLIIEGPVKAALLDVSEFSESLEHHETDDEEIRAIERTCQNFGREVDNSSAISKASSRSDESTTCSFVKLQELLNNINELSYVVNAGQIDIQNKSLQSILAGSRTSIGSEEYAGVDKTTWSILVSQLKILWTLDIRDNLMALTQDLMFTIGFMKAQIRQSQLMVQEQDRTTNPEANTRATSLDNINLEEGVEVTLSPPKPTSNTEGKSRLEYLLQRNSSFDLNIDGTIYNDSMVTSYLCDQDISIEHENPSLPTIDIHFSNPQVQLHRKATGGSIILAMEGVHVEGRKFVRFLVNIHKTKGEMAPSDLTRRTGKFVKVHSCSTNI